MNKVMWSGVMGVVTILLASCGGVMPRDAAAPTPESAVRDTEQYSLDGQRVPAAEVRQLEAQRGAVYLLATPSVSGTVWAVYTDLQALDAAKTSVLGAQGICVGRSRTTVWEEVGYAGSSLEIAKGQAYGDLSTLFQPDGEDWDNDIEAFKAACSAYTYFYTGKNFTGSVWVVRGDTMSDMGGWNNIVSSIVVSN